MKVKCYMSSGSALQIISNTYLSHLTYETKLHFVNIIIIRLLQNNLWCPRPGWILTFPPLPSPRGRPPNPSPPLCCPLRLPASKTVIGGLNCHPRSPRSPSIIRRSKFNWLSSSDCLRAPPPFLISPHPQRWMEKGQVQRKNTIIRLISSDYGWSSLQIKLGFTLARIYCPSV